MTGWRRWLRRATVLLAGAAILYAVLAVLDFQPRALPLVLLCTTVAAVGWAIVDVVVDDQADWEIPVEGFALGPSNRGGDSRFAAYVRALESNQTARDPSAALTALLRRLTEERLTVRHGLTLADPGAADLVGAELLSTLHQPPRRMSLDEIERHLHRIEEL